MNRIGNAIAVIAVGLIGTAQAATAVASLENVVTVVGTCTIGASGFTTTYDPVGANATTPKDVVASVSTVCTNGASVVVTLGQGLHAGIGSNDASPTRRLSSGGSSPVYINYDLHQDASHTVGWGNTPQTGVTIQGNGSSIISTIYARIPPGQSNATPGTYTDTVVATVSF